MNGMAMTNQAVQFGVPRRHRLHLIHDEFDRLRLLVRRVLARAVPRRRAGGHRRLRFLPGLRQLGALLGTVPVADLAGYAEWADQVNPNFNAVTAEYVEAVHDAGMVINTYTVNEVADMARLLDYGVDGIITNRPDVLEDLLAQRNIEKR